MILSKTMEIELIGEVSIYVGLGIQVMMALILGGLVGYDREKKLKVAGLKTNILICLGATLYTSIGFLIADAAGGNADPNRMAAQIVSGIGFLGAGAIIQGRGNVVGLTTAATIWVVAAIGFAVGAGYPFASAIFSITVLFVLKFVNSIFSVFGSEGAVGYFQLEILSKGSVQKTVSGIVAAKPSLDVDEIYEEEFKSKPGAYITSIFLSGHRRQIEHLVSQLKTVLKVERVVYHSVASQIEGGFSYEEPISIDD